MKHKIATIITVLSLPLAFLSGASASPTATPNACTISIAVAWHSKPSYIAEMEHISWRESRWSEKAYSFYQYGCLQVNWGKNGNVHGKWLLAHGITPAMLFRAPVNAYYGRVLFEEACKRGNCLSPWKATA